jgi:hypothetical protein
LGAFPPLLQKVLDVIRADLEDVDERDRSGVGGLIGHFLLLLAVA